MIHDGTAARTPQLQQRMRCDGGDDAELFWMKMLQLLNCFSEDINTQVLRGLRSATALVTLNLSSVSNPEAEYFQTARRRLKRARLVALTSAAAFALKAEGQKEQCEKNCIGQDKSAVAGSIRT